MFQTAQPATASRPARLDGPNCPSCGMPVTGVATTEPGRHEFVDCGHRASGETLAELTP